MPILGLSSATKVISVGLVDGDRVIAEKTVEDIRSERVLLYLQEAGITPDRVQGVAVAVGPGSYSGLRGGLAAAKTLAQTLQVPLAAVSTLEAIAYNLVGEEGTVAAVLDAKGTDYNFALFKASAGKLTRLTDDLVLPLEEIKARLNKIPGVLLAESPQFHPLGINVAKLGALKIAAGETADPLTLAPKYSHLPNIREYRP